MSASATQGDHNKTVYIKTLFYTAPEHKHCQELTNQRSAFCDKVAQNRAEPYSEKGCATVKRCAIRRVTLAIMSRDKFRDKVAR